MTFSGDASAVSVSWMVSRNFILSNLSFLAYFRMKALKAAVPCCGKEFSHDLATEDVASRRHAWMTIFWCEVGVISPDSIFKILSGEDPVLLAYSAIMYVEVSTYAE